MKNDTLLRINQLDAERRIGLSGNFTNPHKLLALLLAVSLTAGILLGLSFLPKVWHESTVLGILTRRGLIPYFTLLGFNWGIMLLWLKSRKVGAQRKAIRYLEHHELGQYGFHADNAKDWMNWLKNKVDTPHDFVLTNRLYSAFASLHALRDPSALPGVVSSHAETDEIQSDESYAFPSMLLFLIPILGFIGTVIGLSQSIGGFGTALSENTDDIANLIASLQNVTGGLAIAFDTTLFALVCALILQIYSSIVRSRETNFLDDCNAFFQQSFFPNIIHPSRRKDHFKTYEESKEPEEIDTTEEKAPSNQEVDPVQK